MANEMDKDVSMNGGTIVVAIVVPSVIVIVLLSFIVACVSWLSVLATCALTCSAGLSFGLEEAVTTMTSQPPRKGA
jgi:hypothetical protein